MKLYSIIYSPVCHFETPGDLIRDDYRLKKLEETGLKDTNPKKYDESVTAGVLIEKIRPEGASLLRDENSKPFFADTDGNSVLPYFNLTHSDGHVFLAYSAVTRLGIDFEPYDRKVSTGVEQRIVTEEEQSFVENGEVLRLFTIKESISKLSGKGIGMNFGKFFVVKTTLSAGPKLKLEKIPDEDAFKEIESEPFTVTGFDRYIVLSDDMSYPFLRVDSYKTEHGYLSVAYINYEC